MAEEEKKATGGFGAITNEIPSGPIALPKLMRGPDGLVHTIYIDSETGEPLTSLEGYSVLAGQNFLDPDSLGGTGSGSTSTDTTTTAAPSLSEEEQQKLIRKENHESGVPTRPDSSWRNQANNFGYIDTPDWVKYTSLLPGPLGVAGGFANFASKANEQEARNAARTSMGLGPDNFRGNLKGLAKTRGGQVAEVKINDTGKTYNVGFEALTPDGKKTNLTPDEARKRSLTLGGMQEVEPKKEKSKSIIKDALNSIFSPEKPSSLGIGSDFASSMRGAIDTVTGAEPSKTTTSSGREIVSGAGLANLTGPAGARAFAGLTSSLNPSKQRPNMPSNRITDAVRSAAANTLGPDSSVDVYSGTENEGKQYGSNRHATGLAGDFDFYDAAGNRITDTNTLSDLASNFAYDNGLDAQIGFGKGYMAPGRMHLDLTGMSEINPEEQSATWGANGIGMSSALRETITAARHGNIPTPFSNAPTPTTRPDPTIDNLITGSTLNPVEHNSILDQVGSPNVNNTATAKAINNNGNKFAGIDLDTISPAKASSIGMTTRTAAQQKSLARTFAGELSPAQLEGLAIGDPAARAEFASMMTTAENRAASKMFSSLEKALTPSQYNSLAEKNLDVTNNNYSKYGSVLDKAVADFYTGDLTSPNYGFSSYYNEKIASPTWGTKMSSTALVGDHTFGSLPEYGANKAFKEARSAYADANRNYSGGGFDSRDNRYDTPREKSGIGIGSSGFGGNTIQNSRESSGRGLSSYSGGTAGKAASSGSGSDRSSISGASRSTAGKTTSGPSASSGSISGASRSTAGKTSTKSSSPTNDGGGKAKSPGGGF